MIPSPNLWHTGTISTSMSRARMLYCGWRLISGSQPLACVITAASAICDAGQFETPMYRTFPSRTRSFSVLSVSSIGVSSS